MPRHVEDRPSPVGLQDRSERLRHQQRTVEVGVHLSPDVRHVPGDDRSPGRDSRVVDEDLDVDGRCSGGLDLRGVGDIVLDRLDAVHVDGARTARGRIDLSRPALLELRDELRADPSIGPGHQHDSVLQQHESLFP